MHKSILVIAILILIPLSARFHDWDNGMTNEYNGAIALIRQNKTPLAIQALTKLAENGNSAAQFRLGAIYEYGFGVEPDIYQSQKWYRMSANSGYAPSRLRLTIICKEVAKGLPILFKEAERGNAGAQHSLAIIYKYGLGVPEDEKLSRMWYSKVAATQLKEKLLTRDKAGQLVTH